MGTDPKKKKRKPSAYNKHIGREMKAGKTMKQAAASWKKKGKGSTPKSKSKAKSKPTGGKKRVSGFNMGKIKSLIRTVASVVPTAILIMDPNLDNISKAKRWITWHTGWRIDEQRWDPAELLNGYGPRIGAEIGTRADTVVRKFIKMLG